MNDQQIPPAQNIEQGLEAQATLDLGEATQSSIKKSETEIATEKQERVKAGFKIVSDIREKVIATVAMADSEADSFQLLDAAPKAESIKSRYTVVTQEITDKQDSPEEVKQLKEEQAKLYLEYAYNTVALLKKKFNEKMSEIITEARNAIAENQKPAQELVNQVQLMLAVATLLEPFQANTEKLVPDLVLEYSQLEAYCDVLNANLLTYLEEDNNFKLSSDQSSKELGRFVAKLRESISYNEIEEISSLLQEQAKRFAESTQDGVGSVDEPSELEQQGENTVQMDGGLLDRLEAVKQQSGFLSNQSNLNKTD